MSSKFIAALLGASVLVSAPVMAADVYGAGSTKDSGVVSSSTRNPFAGLYIGITAGGEFANIDVADTFDGIGADGLIGGAQAGYNLCMGRVCFGPYIEGGLSNVNVELSGIDALSRDWYAQGGLKLGYQIGNSTMISFHGGYEYSEWSSDLITQLGGQDDITTGMIVIGGEIKTLLSPNVALGVKVDYLMLNSADFNNIDIGDVLEESEAIRPQLTLTYHF